MCRKAEFAARHSKMAPSFHLCEALLQGKGFLRVRTCALRSASGKPRPPTFWLTPGLRPLGGDPVLGQIDLGHDGVDLQGRGQRLGPAVATQFEPFGGSRGTGATRCLQISKQTKAAQDHDTKLSPLCAPYSKHL